jgi:hypothetical protein
VLLDLCCGSGAIALTVGSGGAAGSIALGVDICQPAIDDARCSSRSNSQPPLNTHCLGGGHLPACDRRRTGPLVCEQLCTAPPPHGHGANNGAQLSRAVGIHDVAWVEALPYMCAVISVVTEFMVAVAGDGACHTCDSNPCSGVHFLTGVTINYVTASCQLNYKLCRNAAGTDQP